MGRSLAPFASGERVLASNIEGAPSGMCVDEKGNLYVTAKGIAIFSPQGKRLHPGIDGVSLELDDRRATFLPQVWEALPEPREFLVALKHKAGMPADFWSARLNVALYQVTKWKESELSRATEHS